jgi:mannose-1-phosphate guanylyltransferase
MRIVILSGGEGTRLRPLTLEMPKVMVPVLNQPLLEHTILHLKDEGISDFILSLGHSFPVVQAYFGDGRRLGVNVGYTVEKTPLGTAGGVGKSRPVLKGTFGVLNGDIFCSFDLQEMLSFHHKAGAMLTIALIHVADPSMYGVVETVDGGRVVKFAEKPAPGEATTDLINAGMYIMEPEVLKYIPYDKRYSFEHELFPLLLKRGERVFGYLSSSYWMDIGTPYKYLKLHHDLLGNNLKMDDDCVLEEESRVLGPVSLGSGCVIASGAEVSGSVLWRRVNIGKGTRVIDCVIASDCRISEGCYVENCVLGQGVMLPPGMDIKGEVIWPP